MAYIFESESFAKEMIKYRSTNNLTQNDLATELNIARPTISMLENEKIKPTLEQVEKICAQIGHPINAFFHQEQAEPLLYMMGCLNDVRDNDTFVSLLEKIEIRNRYILLNKRSLK